MPESKINCCECSDQDEYKAPGWLTSTYIEETLKVYKKDNSIRLVQMKFVPAVAKGDNYASVMARVNVQFVSKGKAKPQNESYIVKTAFEGDTFVCKRLEEYGIYKCEMNVYADILPKLKTLLDKIGYHSSLAPDSVKIDHSHDLIIFEDLVTKSFVMAERKNGLDLTHTKMVLERLAALHAASAVLNQIAPGSFERYDHGMYNRHTEGFGPYFLNNLETCGNLVSEWKGYEEYGRKLLALIPKLLELGRRVFDAKDRHLNVLTHGDIWINNIMFTYDNDKKPTDTILIDFQYACWTSPTVDLHYFFNSSIEEDLRLNHQDELVKFYYDHFAEFLQKLNFTGHIPSLHEFWIEFVENNFYAFATACLVQPVMMLEDSTDANFMSLMGHDERSVNFRKRIYSNKKVQQNLKTLLPFFDRKGLLDVN